MLLRWFRRRRLRRSPFSPVWEAILRNHFAQWMQLSEPERGRMRDLIRFFIAERHWEGCGGLTLTDQMKVLIAAQASLLLLGRREDGYSNVTAVLVYPSGYFATQGRGPVLGGPRIVEAGTTPVLGQAWERGPVILSWQHARLGAADARDGQNVVFHEFAHKLDMDNGVVDGTPLMATREQAKRWHAVMTAAFARLQGELGGGSALRPPLEFGVSSPLRAYALTNPAEFFAVATEAFFERPVDLRAWDDDLYGVLREFYGQDPAEREDGTG